MDSIKESFEEGKEKISEEIAETKKNIGEAVNKGVSKTKSFLKKLSIFLLIAGIISAAVYFLYTNWTYSEGTRTGTLIKVSEKGYVFKTYEGQLNLGGFDTNGENGIIGNIWNFSVKDDATYKKIQALEGEKVTLHYKEINKAMPWQGETNYFILDVDSKE